MNDKRICLLGLALFAVAATARTPNKSWITFDPHVYLGAGVVDVLKEIPPEFDIVYEEDENYADINSLASGGFAFHSQFRLSLIQIGPLSLGYTFWGFRREYSHEHPDLWFRTDKEYPLMYDLSLHAACLQIDSPYAFWEDRVRPFLVGGYGVFYGASRTRRYAYEKDTGWVLMDNKITSRYDGRGWTAGAGFMFYKYAYVYAGLTGFDQKDLPGRLFLDMMVGLRI